MAWAQLSINRPHLVYVILGGFTSLFMLCSTIIKERLYIGEATVATLCGIIFGPHAANLINPMEWGNVDQITLEFSRIVLVVQCFAVGVELPKNYMERHWKSVTLLLVPVMTFGWLSTSLFIWWMFGNTLNFLDSLCVAACVTATDPVLASSVVGKESGCNDGMAFPFIYLALYLLHYHQEGKEVTFHWFCYTILYECIFGCFYGVVVGYLARRAIRYAHEKDLIDRESFLVFYFVLALFCAGSGSLLGMDDLLVGFACGVGFSNDGWFQEKTEESHVSNVIDLLINLAFFVYFGTIVPWDQFNMSSIGIEPWRLVVVGVMVVFFRRIPIMMALKPIIPDVETWREALFAGHFGPIGVGALFVSILARAELETDTTTPLAEIPTEGEFLNIIQTIWPITCFLVIVSIIIHGSSIAVFTLGRRINTLAISVSFTKAQEEGPTWMDRLPRIQSRSKSSMSIGRRYETESETDEKMEEGALSPLAVPKGFLRQMKDEDAPASRSSSKKASRRRKKWDAGIGPGGPVSSSAIGPSRRSELSSKDRADSDTLVTHSDGSPKGDDRGDEELEEEIYREGSHDIIEDEEGNVLEVRDSKEGETEEQRTAAVKADAKRLLKEKDVEHGVSQEAHRNPDQSMSGEELAQKIKEASHGAQKTDGQGRNWRDMKQMLTNLKKKDIPATATQHPLKKTGPALAYQFGNTIIVEDEDGEVIKKYAIPSEKQQGRPGLERKQSIFEQRPRQQMQRVGTWIGLGKEQSTNDKKTEAGPSSAQDPSKKKDTAGVDDDQIRFTLGSGGRRMSRLEFIDALSRLDPKSRQRVLEESDAPEAIKREASAAVSDTGSYRRVKAEDITRVDSRPEGATRMESNQEDVPSFAASQSLSNHSMSGSRETAAQRRRRLADGPPAIDEDSALQDITRGRSRLHSSRDDTPSPRRPGLQGQQQSYLDEGETAAERRRRMAALQGGDDSSSDEEEEAGGFRDLAATRDAQSSEPVRPESSQQRGPSIRFAEAARPQQASAAGDEAETAGESSGAPSSSNDNSNGNDNVDSHGSGRRLRWGAGVGTKPDSGGRARRK